MPATTTRGSKVAENEVDLLSEMDTNPTGPNQDEEDFDLLSDMSESDAKAWVPWNEDDQPRGIQGTVTHVGTVTQDAKYGGDEVPYVELTDKDGNGLHIEGVQPICFSAIDHRDEDLDPGNTKKQQHPADLPPYNAINLHIDLKQRGVGGDNSWGALPHDPYRLLDKKYSYSYIIKLIDAQQ